MSTTLVEEQLRTILGGSPLRSLDRQRSSNHLQYFIVVSGSRFQALAATALYMPSLQQDLTGTRDAQWGLDTGAALSLSLQENVISLTPYKGRGDVEKRFNELAAQWRLETGSESIAT